MDIIQDVLIYQTQMMHNSSLGPYVRAEFCPPEHIVVVNALFYASLSVMILAAFIAMLIKSWVREFDRGLRALSIPEQRAKTREFRYLGMKRWKLPEMVAILPLLIQISLLLFSIGLVVFLFHISKPSFGVTTAIFGVGVLFYVMTTSIPVFITSSPFHSSLSRTLGKVYQHMHAYLCPSVKFFTTRAMDTTPATSLGRVRRDIQIILQKSRPYPEEYFVEPIAATTMDEVQLSMAASALRRIHESAANSQHSEALHCSVWQIAGSAMPRIPPLFDLPSWILDRGNDEEYFSHLPPAMPVAMVAVWLRARPTSAPGRIATANAVLHNMEHAKAPRARLVLAVAHRLLRYNRKLIQMEPNDIINMIRRTERHREESLWLLSTLSELSVRWRSWEKPFLIGICLAMLLDDAPKWSYNNPPGIVLLEDVVTLAAIACSPSRANQTNILTRSREYPWLLLNIRNPALFAKWFEDTPSDHHEQLISMLFLVLYALLHRDSIPLAVQYLAIITAKGDLPLYTSALTAVAPSMRRTGLSAIVRMLVAPQSLDLASTIGEFMFDGTILEELFQNYDRQLGAIENPDANLLAILLILSKDMDPFGIWALQNLNLELKNPWLRVVAQLDIPEGSGQPMGLFYDHRVNNMIAALTLLRYLQGRVTQYTESVLLASFLKYRELPISFVALEYCMKTAISHSDPSAPSCHLSRAVHAVFNITSPDHQLRNGWPILEIFVSGFEDLPVEWRRAFAEGFFTLSRHPLPAPRGDTETTTPERALRKILTWEYFHDKQREVKFTDSDFSGLDWMAMAWSLHLSQQSNTRIGGSPQENIQPQGSSATAVTEEFVLQALCKLLEATPYHQVIPITPKLCEFVQWFGGTDLAQYRRRISARIEESVHRHEVFQIHHKFHNFYCMWYI